MTDSWEQLADQYIADALKSGDRDSAIERMLGKIRRQREALDILNRRVVSQRFQLRTLEGLGRGLTRDEYAEARAAEQNEQLRNRIDAEPAVA
jgi:hypothetical protein